jgi:hypothetical protein
MESENTKSNSPGRMKIIIPVSLLSLFIVYYFIMAFMAPARRFNAIRSGISTPAAEKVKIDERILSDSAYLMMMKDKAFLQSRVAMAETDSIYLTINLADSSANIEISGVVVYTSRMHHINASRMLRKGDQNVILSMLSSPLSIARDYSTIKKEPVMIKMAPKDTSEYKPDIMPDTSLTEPVSFILEMTNGTRIYVYQEEMEKFRDRMSCFLFDLNDRIRNTWNAIKSIMVLKVPEYYPFIKIRIARADAKIIYRALPRKGQVGIYL